MADMDGQEHTEQGEGPLSNGADGLADARDNKGRFLPGNPGGPGNPNARNVATWRRVLADAVSGDDVAEVTRKLIDAAKDGEPWAVHEFFDRLLGKPAVQVELQSDADSVRLGIDARMIDDAARLSGLLLNARYNPAALAADTKPGA